MNLGGGGLVLDGLAGLDRAGVALLGGGGGYGERWGKLIDAG